MTNNRFVWFFVVYFLVFLVLSIVGLFLLGEFLSNPEEECFATMNIDTGAVTTHGSCTADDLVEIYRAFEVIDG